jgi:DNA gyrase/topoisomerase IV subunit B
MRLAKVEVTNQHAIGPVLEFYMGKNTPERRQYIMDHLVVEVEE